MVQKPISGSGFHGDGLQAGLAGRRGAGRHEAPLGRARENPAASGLTPPRRRCSSWRHEQPGPPPSTPARSPTGASRQSRIQFRYALFQLLLDLDEAETLDRTLKLFSVGRFNLFSHHDRDHRRRRTPAPARLGGRDAGRGGIADRRRPDSASGHAQAVRLRLQPAQHLLLPPPERRSWPPCSTRSTTLSASGIVI